MAQQRSAIRTAALEMAGYNTADPIIATADINDIIQGALDQISTEYEWPWLYAEGTITTVAGTTDYNVPTRWTRTLWLAYKHLELKYRSHRQMRHVIGDTTVTGQPTVFTTVGDTSIRVGRIPDAVYTLDHGYVTSEAVMTSDSDQPALDDAYDDMLVWRVVKGLAIRRGDTDMLQIANIENALWTERARDNVRRTSHTTRVNARRDWTTRT